MPEIEVASIDFNHSYLLSEIIRRISTALGFVVHNRDNVIDLQDFYTVERSQYDAARILQYYERFITKDKALLLTSVDLYLPIFTHVFGLAKLGGKAAIVSSYRLDNSLYGLPADDEKLQERIVKEILHEFGHLYELRHCENYLCVMASSNTADDLDVKNSAYCSKCSESLPA